MIVSIGEAVVDLIGRESGIALEAVETFRRDGGGAPANVAAAAARLGATAAFVGTVGDDPFGRFLIGCLGQAGVDVQGIRVHEQAATRAVFVALDDDAAPDFYFYHAEPADMLMEAEQLPVALLEQAEILHCGALTLTMEPARTATEEARAVAWEQGAALSFAPNIRNGLWSSPEVGRRECWRLLKRTDILTLNAAEAEFLTGEQQPRAAAQRLADGGPSVVFVTMGARGAGCLYGAGAWVTVPSFPVDVVDTTGAGDAFAGAVLAGLAAVTAGHPNPRAAIREQTRQQTGDWWQRLLRQGTAAGALTTTARGAMRAQPTRQHLKRLLDGELTT